MNLIQRKEDDISGDKMTFGSFRTLLLFFDLSMREVVVGGGINSPYEMVAE